MDSRDRLPDLIWRGLPDRLDLLLGLILDLVGLVLRLVLDVLLVVVGTARRRSGPGASSDSRTVSVCGATAGGPLARFGEFAESSIWASFGGVGSRLIAGLLSRWL